MNDKLNPQTPAEIDACEAVSGMRMRLYEHARRDAMTRAVLDVARYRGLSGEDTMTWLAFEALRRVEHLEGIMLGDAMTNPAPLKIPMLVPVQP